jgi:ubiquitin-protein ligase
MTSPLQRRRMLDLHKVQHLAQRSGGRVVVTRVEGNPLHRLVLHIDAVTVGSTLYPAMKQRGVDVEIALPARFPFEAPAVRITSPIVHPNIWTGGAVCLGSKWLPTEGLDRLAQRIVNIVTFHPNLVNLASPANAAAAQWYRDAVRQRPGAFPTDRLGETLR